MSNKIQNSSSLLKPDKEKESSKQYTWISNRQMEEIIFYYLDIILIQGQGDKIGREYKNYLKFYSFLPKILLLIFFNDKQ